MEHDPWKNPFNFKSDKNPGADPGTVFVLSLTVNIFINFSENNSWILMGKKSRVYGTDINECVQFVPNKNMY